MSKPFNFDADAFSSMYGGIGETIKLKAQIAALTKENDRLRSELVEATARASRLAKLHAARTT